MAEFKVDAVELESGTFIQRITIGERKLLIPPLRDIGQADRLSAELRALLQRLRDRVAPLTPIPDAKRWLLGATDGYASAQFRI
jgi:hypothetical protein